MPTPLVPPSSVPVAVGLSPGDHLLVSRNGDLHRLSRDGLLAWQEGATVNTRVFNLGSRDEVRGFAATTPGVGTLVSHPGAAYRYVGGMPGAISDLAGWVPEGFVSPRHMGAVLDGVTDDADALEEADAWVAASEGRTLWVDGPLGLARPVSLRSRHVVVTGSLRPLASFVPDAMSCIIRLGENTGVGTEHMGRMDGWFQFDGAAYCGRAAGTWLPSSGTFPTTGFNGAPIVVGDSFVPTGAGATVDGEAFTTSDRLVALVDAPSSSVFAGQWAKRQALSMLLIDGLSLPQPRIHVGGDHCDRLVQVQGDTANCHIEVAGYRCHDLAREATVGASPEGNRLILRGRSFGRAYSSEGSVLADVWLDVGAQIQGYARPVIEVKAARQHTFSGAIRAPWSEAIRIDQDSAAQNAGVHFDGLTVANQASSGYDWCVIDRARSVTGRLLARQMRGSFVARDVEAIDLCLSSDDQKSGAGYILGGTSPARSVRRGRFTFAATAPDAAVTASLIVDVANLTIEETGAPKAVTVSAQVGSRLVLPASVLSTATVINRGPSPRIALEYVGTDAASATQATSKSTAVTCNALVGKVTTNGALLAQGTDVNFRINNDRIDRGDDVEVRASQPYGYLANIVQVANGFVEVRLGNRTGADASDAVVLDMFVRKGVLT